MLGTGMTKHGHVVHGVPIMLSSQTFCGIPVERLATYWPDTSFPSPAKSASQAPDCKRCLRNVSA